MCRTPAPARRPRWGRENARPLERALPRPAADAIVPRPHAPSIPGASMRPHRSAFLLIAASLLAHAPAIHAAARPASIPTAPVRTGLETLEKQVHKFTLSNGLKFIV